MKTILAFGTFDIFHPGHKFFLNEAALLGEKLIVAIARDTHVKILKNHPPINNQEYRLNIVKDQEMVDDVLLSDVILGSFQIIDKVKPTTIAIGHDQIDLETALKKWLVKQKKEIEITKINHENQTI